MSDRSEVVLRAPGGQLWHLEVTNAGVMEVVPGGHSAYAVTLAAPGGGLWRLSVTDAGVIELANDGVSADAVWLKSPDGQFWQLTVTDGGVLELTAVDSPAGGYGVLICRKHPELVFYVQDTRFPHECVA